MIFAPVSPPRRALLVLHIPSVTTIRQGYPKVIFMFLFEVRYLYSFHIREAFTLVYAVRVYIFALKSSITYTNTCLIIISVSPIVFGTSPYCRLNCKDPSVKSVASIFTWNTSI